MYEKKPTEYLFPVSDIGAGAKTHTIVGPKDKEGRLVDYGIQNVTEAFTDDTLPCYVSVGTAADPDAFGDEFSMVEEAIGAGKTLLSTYDRTHAAYVAAMVDKTIPANTEVLLTCTAPTGGTPAGIGQPYMAIIWDD